MGAGGGGSSLSWRGSHAEGGGGAARSGTPHPRGGGGTFPRAETDLHPEPWSSGVGETLTSRAPSGCAVFSAPGASDNYLHLRAEAAETQGLGHDFSNQDLN